MQKNASLQSYNTFGIDARAEFLSEFSSQQDLLELLEGGQRPSLILGGGSNVLLKGDVGGLVVVNRIGGIEVLEEDADRVKVRVGAGVNWHALVLTCIERGWAGVENLSLIPGCAGAAPMQNIGAYGVELEKVFTSLQALHIDDSEVHTFNRQDCQFGYRESVFKRTLKGQYIILSIDLELNKNPEFHTSYGAIQRELELMGIEELSIKAISDAVIRIRQSKLPDPAQIGNAGSFFKNPVVPQSVYDAIKAEHLELVGYPAGEGKMKLAAGWLIDQAGWKGHHRETHGVHERQALVLVNYGGAKGQEIWDLSQEIMEDIDLRFGVKLEREVNIIG